MFILLVGTPGSGKTQAVNVTDTLWRTMNRILDNNRKMKVAPHSVSRASLTDVLSRAGKTLILDPTTSYEYHSLQIAAGEFGNLVPAHDLEFLNFLNDIYDNRASFGEEKRGGDLKINIINPQINLIAGTQPAYLANLLPEEAWGMGFMTRIIMVHSAAKMKPNLFGEESQRELLHLAEQMKPLLEVYGQTEIDSDAKQAIQGWWSLDGPPIPTHSRLTHYNSRRILHILRLCLVSAASAGHPLRITHADFVRASDWLIAAEQTMPDIFRDMVGKSDAQLIKDLHLFVWQIQARDKKPPLENRLILWLQSRVPAERIPRILDTVERANIMTKIIGPHGTYYQARPLSDFGVE